MARPSSYNIQIGAGYGTPTGVNQRSGLNSRCCIPNGLILFSLTPIHSASQSGYMLNTFTLNGGVYDYPAVSGHPIALDLSLFTTMRGDYWLELRDNQGELLGELPDYWGGQWTDEVNAPGTLSFTYPAEDALSDYFVNPNEIWLYRGNTIYPIRAFIIQAVTWTDGEDRTVQVSCEGLLSQWSIEVLRDYDAGGVVTVRDVLNAWTYSYQNISPGIFVGEIDPWILFTQVTAAAENKTMLQAFRDLHEAIGGYYYVTPRRRLCWKSTVGNDLGHTIRYGRNAIEIRRSIDYRSLNNRLVATGVVNGADTTVTVNDVDSQEDYGIRTGYYETPDVMTNADFNALADAELLRRSVPEVVIECEAIDLSHVNYLAYEWEALAMEPGSKVHLVRRDGNGTGTAITCRVYKVERNLDSPEQVRIEVGDTTRNVGNVITYRPRKTWLTALSNVMGYVQRQVQAKAGVN